MRVECIVTMSGVVDGVEIPEASTRMRVELVGSWKLEGRALVHRVDRAKVTPEQPEMREFAALVESMYREFPTVTADVEKWDGITIRVRDQSTGEEFEMTRISANPLS